MTHDDRPHADRGDTIIVTAIADDRPGLMRAILEPIHRSGFRIESLTATSLKTATCVTLFLHVPAGQMTALRAVLVGLTVEHNVTLNVHEIPDGALHTPVDGLEQEIVFESIDDFIAAAKHLERHGATIRSVRTDTAHGALTTRIAIRSGIDAVTLAQELHLPPSRVSPLQSGTFSAQNG